MTSLVYSGYQSIGEMIVRLSAAFYHLFYQNVGIINGEIISINNEGVLRMLPACTGLKQLFQIFLILLLYPVRPKLKLLLVVPTLLVVFFAALLHFTILVPVAYEKPGWFLFFHDHLSRIIFFSFFFILWLLWEKMKKDPHFFAMLFNKFNHKQR
jgi:exosortase/archaeosortase family protein